MCVQRRSADAHEAFLKLAHERFSLTTVDKEDVRFTEDDECEIFELRWKAGDLEKKRKRSI